MWRQTLESGATVANDGPPVVLIGSPSPLAVMVLEIGAIVGVQVHACDGFDAVERAPALILMLPDARWPGEPPDLVVSCPRVTVGESDDAADLTLPRQAHLLAQLLADPAVQRRQRPGDSGGGERSCLLVCGAQGGVGTSTAAAALARGRGLVLLDASGHPPIPPMTDRLTWGNIDATDPPLPTDLLAGLPRTEGLRQLGPLPGDAVGLTDPRVAAVVRRSPGKAVIDAGIWDPRVDGFMAWLVSAGVGARLVLASGADERGAMRTAGVLAAASPLGMPRLVLSPGRRTDTLRIAAEEWGVPVERSPGRRSRGWRSLWQRIWEE